VSWSETRRSEDGEKGDEERGPQDPHSGKDPHLGDEADAMPAYA
jgi:hypothetical protein